MISANSDSSPRSCRSGWPSAVFFVVMAAALAASFSGCTRTSANVSSAPGDTRVNAPQVRTLVSLQKKTPDGQTVEVPLAEEYRTVRPAGATPAIPPSETWPAQ